MVAKNDVTGDKIQSKSTTIPKENWEAIFGMSKFDKWLEEKRKAENEQKHSQEGC